MSVLDFFHSFLVQLSFNVNGKGFVGCMCMCPTETGVVQVAFTQDQNAAHGGTLVCHLRAGHLLPTL